jgi:hypothetical protein
MKKPDLTRVVVMNWWLTRYHNVTVDELVAKEPKELTQTPEWFTKYAVTKQQHDEWYDWVIGVISSQCKVSLKEARRLFSWNYLDTAPSYPYDPTAESIYQKRKQQTVK